MTVETHAQLANFIWSICNLLRGPYKRNEYRKVILPLTVLRRFDCLLAPTKARILVEHKTIKTKPETVVRSLLEKITRRKFYNLSKLDLPKLLDDPNQLAPNLNAYINGFSKNVREIMERFDFGQQIERMAEKNLLFEVVKKFAAVDLSYERVDNSQMGYVFEELIRIGAEQSNEEAGEHFTPREVIKLMVNLLLSPEQDLRRSHVVKTIYDPACGTGGMLSVAERYIERTHSGAINLGVGEAAPVRSPTDVGTGKAKDDKAPLSEIIEVLNKRFGTLFTEEDRLFFQQIKEKACNSEQVVRTALANPLDKFELGIRKLIEDLMIERMAENDKIVTRYMADRDFQSSAFPILAREIFEAVRAAVGQGTAGSGESESKTDSKTA